MLFTAALAGALALVPADRAAAEFGGKRIEAVVPFGEGGGADTYTRYMARMLGQKLPGTPTIVIRNIPGGGSVNGANWFEANAKADGTHFAVASTSTTLTSTLRAKDPNIKFKPEGWIAFIGSPMGKVIYVHSKTGIKSVADLKGYKDELLMGLQNPTGSDMPTLLSLELLGVNIKPVLGTDGGDQHLGFQRGELTLNADVTSAYKQMAQPLIDAGTAVPLFTMGYADESGAIVRDPNFPDLPSWVEAYETIHGKKPAGTEYDAWLALFHLSVMSSKALVLPAGTPADVVKIYNEAAAELVKDETFKKESGEFIGTYPQLTGDAARKSLVTATSITPEARAWVTDWLNKRFKLDL
jgi:hypothetical protein